jgi:hypothetical protein
MGFFILFPASAQGYGSGTHEMLTSEAITFYNKHFDQKVPDALWAFLRDGSRREDDPPRWMNHFYDPVHERGLSPDNAIDPLLDLGTWEISKAWAQDSKSQQKLAYSPLIATILSSLQSGKIEKYLPTSDFAWKEALRYQIQGDAEMAAFALGHILHLMQDMSVPDHTRNDAHPGDSPYENYADQFTSQNPDKSLASRLISTPSTRCASLDACFDGLAAYSNNNFYSKDTVGIQSGFELPQSSTSYVSKDDFEYIMNKDNGGNEYFLSVNKRRKGSLIISNTNDLTVNDLTVKQSYWSLLSPKAVAYSAGIIDLFLREAEANKNNPEFAKASDRTFFAQIAAAAENAFGAVRDAVVSLFSPDSLFKDTYTSTLSDKQEADAREPQESGENREKQDGQDQENGEANTQGDHLSESEQDENRVPAEHEDADKDGKKPESPSSHALVSTPKPKEAHVSCPISNVPHAPASSILFNEIAWMGSATSSSDEWMELKSIAGKTISLQGWSIRNRSGSLDIDLSKLKNPAIADGKLLLLERTDDKSSPAPADLIYTGAIANSHERLILFDKNCIAVDDIEASPSWKGGDSASRRTMQRDPATHAWGTSPVIGGTPGKENPTSLPSPSPAPAGGSSGKSSSSSAPKASPSPSPSAPLKAAILRITEIMYNPQGNDEGREWIEVRNEGSIAVALEDMKLAESGQRHGITPYKGAGALPPGGYAIITSNPDGFLEAFPAFNGLLFDSSFSLKNTGERVGIEGGGYEPHTASYDPLWGGDDNGKSLQWNGNAFIEALPTPGNPYMETLNTQSARAATHVLISELQVSGQSADDEWIELYNPTDAAISLDGYSFQYISGQADDLSSIQKKNFEPGSSVPAHGFFLIANKDGTQAPRADLAYSFPLSGQSGGGILAIVATTTPIADLHDASIADLAAYGDTKLDAGFRLSMPKASQSMERMAFENGACASLKEEGAFKGNGCDTDTRDDFTETAKPFSQNTKNLPEPRRAPNPITNLALSYETSTLTVHASWNDGANASSPFPPAYTIYRSSGTDSAGATSTATTTSADIRITTVGTRHVVQVSATDQDGLSSAALAASVWTPTFIKSLYYYADASSTPRIDIAYESYPFLPTLYGFGAEASKKAVVFFGDMAPTPPPTLINSPSDPNNAGQAWTDEMRAHVMEVEYETCAQGNGPFPMLTLFDEGEGRCYNNTALRMSSIEPDWLRIVPKAGNPLASYVTVAFYDKSGGVSTDDYSLLAADATRYERLGAAPHESPTAPEDLAATLYPSPERTYAVLAWKDAHDPDGPDRMLRYQFRYAHESEDIGAAPWEAAERAFADTIQTHPQFDLAKKGGYAVQLRAIDESGLESSYASTTISSEAAGSLGVVAKTLEQVPGGSNAAGFKTMASSTEALRIAQSFRLDGEYDLTSLHLAIEKSPWGPSLFKAIVSIRAAAENPDASIQPAETSLWSGTLEEPGGFSRGLAPYASIALPPLSLDAGTYFIVMETQGDYPEPGDYLLSYTASDNPYSYGDYYWQDATGTWNAAPDTDLHFLIQGISR